MGRVSDFIFTFVNCVMLLVSLVAIGFSIWLNFNNATLCQRVLQKAFLLLGVSALLVSVLLLVGSNCRVTFIAWICVILMWLLILGALCFSVFTILVTNRNASRALFGRGGDYSHYLLKKYVMDAENWKGIKSCLADYKYCLPSSKVVDFFKYGHFQFKSSCCKPPTYCGLEFHNATYWTMPKTGPAVADNDCKIWSNVQSELCFNCQSCTTAFLDHIEEHLKLSSFANFVVFLVYLFAFCVYGCALRKNRPKGYQRDKVYPA